jgi:16S rRNA (uracil1498-N3)-methyltransferase
VRISGIRNGLKKRGLFLAVIPDMGYRIGGMGKKVHRFIVGEDLLPTLSIQDKALVHQWSKVLKFETGEELELCDGRGHEANYRITGVEKKRVDLERAENVRENEAEPERHVILYAAVLKKENFDWIVQKTTECGVAEIVPLVTDRTIKKSINLDRAKEIAREAAEQSGRGRVPNIHEPLSLKAALAHAKMNGQNYFFHVSEITSRKPQVASSEMRVRDFAIYDMRPANGLHRIGLFIGPEGGWTEEEADLALKAGCEIASLGPRTLRGETACAVAVYVASA